jgi:membrane protein YdbS with pleckstrin-like domain
VGFPRRLLADHEELILDMRPHWIALAAPVAVAVLVLLAEMLLFANFDPPAVVAWLALAVGAVLLLAFSIRPFLAWITSHFVVTSDRVIHRSGWLAKRSMEMPLERINDVRFQQSVLERVVGAGDLVIESGGEYGQNLFSDIRHPEDVQKLIYEKGEENEHRTPGTTPPSRASRAPTEPITTSGGSPLDEIEQLAALKERGLISDEEFETQKLRLLGRL